MLCQNCGKDEATTHVKQIINGEMTETDLCPDCAMHLGFGDMFSGFGLNLAGLFGGLMGDMMPSIALENVKKCPKCGCSFSDIVREGKVGCSECYRTFYDKLLPSIQRIHGKIKHSGKISPTSPGQSKIETSEEKIEKLTARMNEAVSVQDFELAAKIRDEIKALKGGSV